MGVEGQVRHLIQYHCSFLLWFIRSTTDTFCVHFNLPSPSCWSSGWPSHCVASLRGSTDEKREGGGGGDTAKVPDTLSIPSPGADSDDSVLLVSRSETVEPEGGGSDEDTGSAC